jgi:hypothetical protein
VKVRTLGRFEVRIDNDALRFEGKTPRKALTLLRAIIATCICPSHPPAGVIGSSMRDCRSSVARS